MQDQTTTARQTQPDAPTPRASVEATPQLAKDSSTRTSDAERWLAQVVDVLAAKGSLPPAERDVLEGLLLGRAYAEIATIRGTSPHTVGAQVKAVLRRVGASSSRDLFRVFLCELDRSTIPASSSATPN